MASILIAGCGDIGSGLATDLVNQGHEVYGIRRTHSKFPPKVIGIVGDICELEEGAFPKVDIVFLIMTPQGRTPEAYHAAYVATSERLAEVYQKHANQDGPHIFFISSTSVYGAELDGKLDINEATPATPSSATGKVLAQAEQVWLSGCLNHTLVRFSGIYGPGRYRMLDKIAQGQGIHSPNQWTNRIHRDDCVACLSFLAQSLLAGVSLETIYIATDQVSISQWELVNWLGAKLGVEQTPDAALTLYDMAPKKGKQLSSAALQNLGYAFIYPSYQQGYLKVIQTYQKA